MHAKPPALLQFVYLMLGFNAEKVFPGQNFPINVRKRPGFYSDMGQKHIVCELWNFPPQPLASC